MVRTRSFALMLLSAVLMLTMLTPVAAVAQPGTSQDPHVLVFSHTAAFRHASIPTGVAAIEQLGAEEGFTVDTTEDPTDFTSQNLAQYDAVIWLSTTGSVLNAEQQAAFEGYIQSGGGYVGIHAAADTHYDWAWYGDLVGAYFSSHPPGMQNGDVWVTDNAHPSTGMLPSVWNRTEEWYHFDVNPRGDVHVLATLDEASYRDDYPNYDDWMGHDHPIAWCQNDYDGGRSWYTAGGHDHAHFSEDLFLDHMTGGILWAAGAVEGDCGGTIWDNYEKAVLDTDTSSLMKMDIADDGRVFYTQRSGGIFVIDAANDDEVSTVANLDVYTGDENGLMGIALDPEFNDNDRVWLYYSPANSVVGDDPRQFLSNFELDSDGTLDLSSEQVVLEVPHQREECCHAGGHLKFGPDGDIWLAIGDDTNPFASQNYTPIDERPGREYWDAQRTSANTNDLRGSLLRITPTADGSDYTIPEGNLFEPGTELTRPEIHTMGLRNPYTFSVDSNGTVYLGDYGPDAGAPHPDRGPQNQVTWHIIDEAQNAGWPYCKGDNIPYIDWDFETETPGDAFDCDNPVNDSPNNTGLTELPPTTPATVWYSYDGSDAFPMLAGGGPTAGPRYEYDPDLDSAIKWPASFDGSALLGEWNTNNVWEIALTEDGLETTQISRMFPNLSFQSPHDFAFSPYDGALYMLEWGSGFGDGGPNSQVVRVEYHGAQDPDAPDVSVTATPTSGEAPLEVTFEGSATSPVDADVTSFVWDFGDGSETVEGQQVTHTYDQAGTYRAELTVTDADGRTGTAGATIQVIGDETPPGGDLFCPGDLFDNFSGDELDLDRWSETVREDASLYSVGDGSLTVDVTATDIYGTDNTDTPNIFLQEIPEPDEPWEATVQLTMEAYQSYQQAGLIVYGDDDNYGKMVLQGRSTSGQDPANRVFQFIREENGEPNEVDASNTPQLGADYPDTVWVRLTSDGSNLQAWYSDDGSDFTMMPETKQMDGIDNPRIGLFAVAGVGQSPTTADFEQFVFSPDPGAERPALVSDEFDGDELDGCRWDRVVNYAPEFLEVADGVLRIEVQEGDIYEGANDDLPNLILQTQPDGDWTVETHYTEELLSGFSQAGLMVYVDDDNYVKLDTVADVGSEGVNRIELRSEVDGQIQNPEPDVTGDAFPSDNDGEWWLRLSKEADVFSGSFSIDGENWTDIEEAVPNALAAAEGAVGLFTLGAQETTPTTVEFDYFRLLGEEDPGDPGDPGEPGDVNVEATLSPSTPDGENDWYVSPVEVSLSSDNDDAELQWRAAGESAWTTWTDAIVIDTDGEHNLEYRAVVGGEGSAPAQADVDILGGAMDGRFEPDLIEVAVDGDVEFTLREGGHDVNVTDENGEELASSPFMTTPGATFEFSPSEAGVHYIYCSPHSDTSDPNPENWTGMVAQMIVSEAGTELVSEVGEVSFKIDQTPPQTTASLDGEVTAGVYTGEVAVSLAADDATSGVAETRVRASGEGDGDVYVDPLTFSGIGEHTVEFRSIDDAGNTEQWQSVTFEIVDESDVPEVPEPGPLCDDHQDGATFPDSRGSGHHYFIDCLAELGIVGGFTDGTYGPALSVTREQLASFVVRSLEHAGEELEAGGALFSDVHPGSEHGQSIYKLRNAGVIHGYEDGTFDPRGNVTRDQTARFVTNALELVLGEELETSGIRFPDVTMTQYEEDIDKLATAEIIGGFTDGTFGPRLDVTRGQMARFIGGALDLLHGEGAF